MRALTEPREPAWVPAASAIIRRMPAGRYRAIQAICGRVRPAPFWRDIPGGGEFLCDLRDSIAREVCFTGQYEPQETLLVRRILGPGAVFVDVGANWGYFSLLAARIVGPAGRVISLEPDPRNFARLASNARRGGGAHWTTHEAAAAARDGALELAGYDESGDNFGVSRIAAEGGYRVPARRLDEFLNELSIGRTDLVKMDIEGYEDEALDGMAQGLREGRYRRILLELHPALLAERGRDAARVCAMLATAGYRGWAVDHSPRATSDFAYGRAGDVSALLRPLDAGKLGDWPHTLWSLAEPLPTGPRA